MCDGNEKDEILQATNDDAYMHTCNCPYCNRVIYRRNAPGIIRCNFCGKDLKVRAFTQEELDIAIELLRKS